MAGVPELLSFEPALDSTSEENEEVVLLKCFSDEALSPSLLKRAREELGETAEVRQKCLLELKELIEKEPDFHPCTEDAFLLRYLRARKFKVAEAFKTLTNFYKFKAQHSGKVSDLTPEDLRSIFEQEFLTVLEYRDQNEAGILYIKFDLYDETKFNTEQMMATYLIVTDIMLTSEATQVAGINFIYDWSNVGLSKMKFLASPTLLYNSANALENCYPCRIKGMHAVYEPHFIDLVYKVLRMFISEKLDKRIKFHGEDMNSLHEYVRKDVLPSDFGGKQESISTTTKKFLEKIFTYEDYFREMNKYGYRGETLEKLAKGNYNTRL